jgi:hypothetical protein
MTKTTLVADWLDNTLSEKGLEDGLSELAQWARDLNPLEREFVRSVALDVVYGSIDFPAWCPTYRGRRETARRLVEGALGD